MLLGSVRLSDGSSAVGFACDAVAAANGTDITRYGDWLAALAASEGGQEGARRGSSWTGQAWTDIASAGGAWHGRSGQGRRGTLGDALLTGFTRGIQPGRNRR